MRESKSVLQQNIELHRHEAYYYNAIHPENFNIFEQNRLRRELKALKAEMDSSLPVLDIGSGTGNLVNHLQRLGLDVIASDLSAEMLAENPAKHKLICDAEHLPFKDDCFGAITSYSVFHHLPDIGAALKDMCRVAAGQCILYFDHDPFLPTTEQQVGRYHFNFKDLVGWLVWILIHPKYWWRLVRYAAHGRIKHMQNLAKLTEAETEEPMDMDLISVVLEEQGFDHSVHGYGESSFLKCRRKQNSRQKTG